MCTRISERLAPLAALGLLAACGADAPEPERVEERRAEAADDSGRILCAVGNVDLTRDCTIDRTVDDSGTTLAVRRPDGGFHRLLVTKDGTGVAAADGAQAASVVIVGGSEIDVTIGDARYRIPARIDPVAQP